VKEVKSDIFLGAERVKLHMFIFFQNMPKCIVAFHIKKLFSDNFWYFLSVKQMSLYLVSQFGYHQLILDKKKVSKSH